MPGPDASRPAEAPLSRDEELERALDSGIAELPPNQPKGILGEKGPDLRKEEDFAPDLNAGLSQEVDLPVLWMAIVLAYLLFFPLAFVILWRSQRISLRFKIAASVVGVAGVAGAATWLVVR